MERFCDSSVFAVFGLVFGVSAFWDGSGVEASSIPRGIQRLQIARGGGRYLFL